MRCFLTSILVVLLTAVGCRAAVIDSVWIKVPVVIPDSVWVQVPVSRAGVPPAIAPAMAPAVPAEQPEPESESESDAEYTVYLDMLRLAAGNGELPGTVDVHTDSTAMAKPAPRHYDHGWHIVLPDEYHRVHFSWGAEAGSSIDLSGHDMSSIDFNASFGLRYRWLRFAGIGAGANLMISNSCRTYPIFATFRTDFSSLVRPVFLDLRGGIALNYLPANVSQRGAYASVALGFTLATARNFRSYITAGYTLVTRSDVHINELQTIPYADLGLAGIRLGISF